MAKEYLDKAGLTYFWSKVKAYITNHGVTGIDYIVEQNIATNSGYTKWNSGKMEYWERVNRTISSTTQWNSFIYYGSTSAVSYPVTFSEYPTLNITVQSNNATMWVLPNYNDYSKTGTGTIYVASVNSRSNQACTLNIHAVGRWK